MIIYFRSCWKITNAEKTELLANLALDVVDRCMAEINQAQTLYVGDAAKVKIKRPMGHIAHLRKQFKSINTYDYNVLLEKKKKT